jgi:lysylphosphatidylglycerol synthetase-like protein (DUF2156 family)
VHERWSRITQVVLFAQAAASVAIWIVQLLTIAARLDHNQEVPGTVWFVAVVNPVIALLVAVAALFLRTRSWARSLAVAMEVVGIVGALVSVITGFYQALAAIALAIAVITVLVRYRTAGAGDIGTVRRRPPEGHVAFRLLFVGAAVATFAAAGCSSQEPTVCQGGFCSVPAYSPSTATRIENGVVAVATVIGLVPVVPRSAAGPARRTTGL